eukprot:1148733-Pelagomonas_calceolata.AAC.3
MAIMYGNGVLSLMQFVWGQDQANASGADSEQQQQQMFPPHMPGPHSFCQNCSPDQDAASFSACHKKDRAANVHSNSIVRLSDSILLDDKLLARGLLCLEVPLCISGSRMISRSLLCLRHSAAVASAAVAYYFMGGMLLMEVLAKLGVGKQANKRFPVDVSKNGDLSFRTLVPQPVLESPVTHAQENDKAGVHGCVSHKGCPGPNELHTTETRLLEQKQGVLRQLECIAWLCSALQSMHCNACNARTALLGSAVRHNLCTAFLGSVCPAMLAMHVLHCLALQSIASLQALPGESGRRSRTGQAREARDSTGPSRPEEDDQHDAFEEASAAAGERIGKCCMAVPG